MAMLSSGQSSIESPLLPGEAVERFFRSVRWLPRHAETVLLDAAHSRICAEDFLAPSPLPAEPRAEMDGYAVRVGAPDAIRPRRPVAVFAGSILPRGTNAVIAAEKAKFEDGDFHVDEDIVAGTHIVQPGSEVRAGATLFQVGTAITASHLGILASFAVENIRVFRRPTIALVTFGSERISRSVLTPTLVSWGTSVLPLHASCDEPDMLLAPLKLTLKHADAVILAGELSYQRRSAAAAVIDRLSPGGVVVNGVRMMPCSDVVLGVVDDRPVIGLSGDPVAALESLIAVVKPIIWHLIGRSGEVGYAEYTAGQPIRGKRGWDCLVPVRTVGRACVPIRRTGSVFRTLTDADGFVRVPANVGEYRKLDLVEFEPIA